MLAVTKNTDFCGVSVRNVFVDKNKINTWRVNMELNEIFEQEKSMWTAAKNGDKTAFCSSFHLTR